MKYRGIYAAPSYAMGDEDDVVVQTDASAAAPVTKASAAKAKAELRKMRDSLKEWLHYRAINTQVASGKADKVPTPLLKRPGARAPDPRAMSWKLGRERYEREQQMALQLHALLSEVFDAGDLPEPDLSDNPRAAVELANIAIAGKLPGEAPAPSEQGLIWLWPLVIIVGAIAFTITSHIRNQAEIAKERERLECIEAGKCTDYGFWLKIGAVGFLGWLAWDKLGLGKKIKGALK